ncbi:hypothetical protein SAMN05444413_1014 [Roseivivax marinus]|uniref:DUF6206 family protein n=1 Tax=Roseivivax marinus TaxID=1379903 RepID=UPI0008C2C3DD|nr:DUF6206 family protein [Roseivivax marinus]SEK19494.1 hypothetical protein SAMN05444413_1014 [Roseivivax marinus]
MSETEDLADLIRADGAARGRTISRLGYFCAPFRPESGPYADRVIKVYRALPDRAALDRLAAAHDDYVAALHDAGVPLPETRFHLVDMGETTVPVIVQKALPDESLMRPLMQAATRDETLEMMQAAGEVIARFWLNTRQAQTRLGFHPSIRNFAIIDGGAVFFDTFPPLIHYSRDEMGRLLLQFSEKRLMRIVGPAVMKGVTAIQDEWYSPPETLVGLVGSACRLRPELTRVYLDWGRTFAREHMEPWADEAVAALDVPPRLPGYWTSMRRMLGLQGAPNV